MMFGVTLNWTEALAVLLNGPTKTPVVVARIDRTTITGDEFEQGLVALGDIWAAAKAKGVDANKDLIAVNDIANIVAELDPPLAPMIAVGQFLVPLFIKGYQTGAIVGEAPGPSYENSPNFKNR